MNRFITVLLSLFLLLPATARSDEPRSVELVNIAEVEVMQKNEFGTEVAKRVAADKANVVPGDTVIYTIIYTNYGNKPATDIVINNPVPEQMIYVDKSAEGAGTRIDFSVDRGKSFAPLEKLKLRDSAGKERPAIAGDVSNIRWTLEKPLKPGGTGRVSFRAKVS